MVMPLIAAARMIGGSKIKQMASELMEGIQEGAVDEAKRYGIEGKNLEDVVKQATDMFVKKHHVDAKQESASQKSVKTAMNPESPGDLTVTNEYLAQILETLKSQSERDVRNQELQKEQDLELRDERRTLLDRLKGLGGNVGEGIKKGASSSLGIAAIAGGVAYSALQFLGSDTFKQIAEKGLGVYLMEQWETVKSSIGSTFDTIVEKLTTTLSDAGDWIVTKSEGIYQYVVDRIEDAGDWIADSFSSLVESIAEMIDGVIGYIKNIPGVSDFVKDALPETEREKKSKQEYRNKEIVKKYEESQSLLAGIDAEIKEEEKRIGVRTAVMMQTHKLTPEETKAYADKEMASGQMKSLQERRQKHVEYQETHKSEYEQAKAPIPEPKPKKSRAEARAEQRAQESSVSDPEQQADTVTQSAPISDPEQQVDTVTQAAPVSGSATGEASAILDLIGQKESRGNYNALVYGNNTPKSANLTDMTLDEVFQYQSKMIANGHASTAVGKYQFIKATLKEAASAIGIDGSTKFSPEVQDRLAMYLLEKRGWRKFKSGAMDKETFARNLSKEWASFPKDASGVSYYAGVAGNQAGVKWEKVMDTLSGEGVSGAQVASALTSTASVSPSASSSSGQSLIQAQTKQSQTKQEISQSPAPVQVINTTNSNGLDTVSMSLRNDDPPFKRIIEQLAMNALGITGSPLANV